MKYHWLADPQQVSTFQVAASISAFPADGVLRAQQPDPNGTGAPIEWNESTPCLIRHKARPTNEGTSVPLQWSLWFIVEFPTRAHLQVMTAIYRALIEPLLEQVRRAGLGETDQAPVGLGLALGGGFARGFAHLGVLQVLEESQIPIWGIAGTSVGSILAAAYASGTPLARIASVCRKVRFRDFGRLRISRLGLATNDRIADLISRSFNAMTFEELLIPLAVVATDLGTGEPVVFREGELADAIRSSCAFPGLFEPVQIGGRCLADGGLVAPVPTKALVDMGASCVVAVSVGFNNWNGAAPKNLLQVVSRAVSAAQKYQTSSWESYADVLLEPDVQSIEWDEFHRADEAIAAGITAARRALPRIRELLRLPQSAREQTIRPAGHEGWKEGDVLT